MRLMDFKTAGPATGRRSAFTLVEVVVSVGVVGIMFVTLYLGISAAFSMTEAERENLRATQVILERMEGIRLFTWDQLLDSAKNPPTFTTYFAPSAVNPGVTYSGTVTVTTNVTLNPSATYSANMRAVTVQVSWTSRNVTHTRSMSTYASKNGVQNYIFNN
jgi:type II secretory pathway pseudopilin PulG